MKKIIFLLLITLALQAKSQNLRYLESRIPKGHLRHNTFLEAMNLMTQRDAKTIVETGSSRHGSANCLGDGCSTVIFSDWAKANDATIYSVDISLQVLQNAAAALDPTDDHVHFIHSDSVEFLQNFGQKIDFLYLDSYDFEVNDPLPSQEHHLKEVKAALPWLGKKSVIMIDDCDLPHGGKGKLAIEYLKKRDWKVLTSSYQVILVHK